jgi:tRNA(adenine34) deaminase
LRYSKNDAYYMREALKEALKAERADEVPVGAVVVKGGKLIARGRNRMRERRDPTAHAELLALQAASRRLQNERLGDTILFTTLEPCPMCAGALVWARVAKVVYGAADPKAGAGGSLLNVLQHPGLNHRLLVKGAVLARKSRDILRRFFRRKRAGRKT